MKKVLSLALLAAMCAAWLCGCAPSSSSGSGSSGSSGNSSSSQSSSADASKPDEFAQTPTWEFPLSTSHQPTSVIVQTLEEYCEAIYQNTKGQLKLNLFPASQIATEKDGLLMMSQDELEFACHGSTPIDMFCPQYNFFTAPFLFNSIEHMQNLLDGELGNQFKDALRENNIETLGTTVIGFRELLSNKDVNSIEDVQGLKLRIPEIPTWQKIWSALGANPMPIVASERYTALQNHVVDATEGTWENNATNSFFEVCDYAIETNHVPEFYAIYASKATLDTLPEDIQQIVRETSEEYTRLMGERCRAADARDRQTLIDKGMDLHEIDLTNFWEKAGETYSEYFQNEWSFTSYEDIMSYAP